MSGKQAIRESPVAAANRRRIEKLRSLRDTDAGNAEAFEFLYGHRFRYDHSKGKWLVWNDRHWVEDRSGEAQRAALVTVRARLSAAILLLNGHDKQRRVNWALRSESVAGLEAMLKSAQSLKSLATNTEDYDRDPYLLAVGNGTLDLRTGRLRRSRPEDLLTKAVEVQYDPAARSPRWIRFLNEVFDGDQELIGFIQRSVGYSLTGDTREQCFFILYGGGANGKTTFLETLMDLLGTHAVTASFSTFLAQRHPGVIRNDLAALQGARFVKAAEGEHQAALDEAVIKQLTGGDTITARFLYHEPFSFKPQFKIWLATNHKPEIRGTDEAIWRRIRLIEFKREFKGLARDPELRAKLAAELPGILAWAVEGCRQWMKRGLGRAATIDRATRGYRQESDQLGRFLRERCIQNPKLTVPAKALHDAYVGWCAQRGERALQATSFAQRVAERGMSKKRGRRGVTYQGLGLAPLPKSSKQKGGPG